MAEITIPLPKITERKEELRNSTKQYKSGWLCQNTTFFTTQNPTNQKLEQTRGRKREIKIKCNISKTTI